MLYLPIIVLVAVATIAMTKRSPRKATMVGVAAVVGAALAVGIAELSGNLLLFYLGSLAGLFGVLVLLARAAAGLVRGRADDIGVRR